MNKEALLAELDRLLDAGEPSLNIVFPEYPQYGWELELRLPDNISDEMEWYADDVAWRAMDRKRFQDSRQRDTTTYLTTLIERNRAGLLGWRAIGVLK